MENGRKGNITGRERKELEEERGRKGERGERKGNN